MGLDIRAYSNLLKIVPLPEDDEEMEKIYEQAYDLNQVVLYENPHFPGRAEGLDSGYLYQATEEPFGFRAGSYSGYGRYRDTLSMFVGMDPGVLREDPIKFENYPFFEQVWFSDCDGFIGPIVSRKLYLDYYFYQEKFQEEFAGDEYSLFLYDQWKTAFGIAFCNGAVVFV